MPRTDATAWCRRLGIGHRDPHLPPLPSHTAPWGEQGAWRTVPGAGASLCLSTAVWRARQPGPPGACTCPGHAQLPLPLLGPLPWAGGPLGLPVGFLCALSGLTPAPRLWRPLLHLVLYSSLKPGNPDKEGCGEGAQRHTTAVPLPQPRQEPAQGRTRGPVPAEQGLTLLWGDVRAEAEALCPKWSVCGCVCTWVPVTLHAGVYLWESAHTHVFMTEYCH